MLELKMKLRRVENERMLENHGKYIFRMLALEMNRRSP